MSWVWNWLGLCPMRTCLISGASQPWLFWILCGLAFLIGSIPTAYCFGKWIKGIDIRQYGSGNVGATNAGRLMGREIGLCVYAIDFLKGALPVYFFSKALNLSPTDFKLLIGIGFSVILGHIFSPWMGFRGGKGIATGGGVLALSQPIIFLSAVLVWIISYKISKIVSLSSILGAVAMPVTSLLLGYPRNIHYCLVLTACIALWSHRSNIKRLWSGTGA